MSPAIDTPQLAIDVTTSHIDSGTPQPVEGFVQSAGSRGVQSVGSFAFLAVFDLSGFQAQGFTPHEEERRQ